MFCTMLLNYIHKLFIGKVIQHLVTYLDHLDTKQKGSLGKKNTDTETVRLHLTLSHTSEH